jgi:hypothetical protein
MYNNGTNIVVSVSIPGTGTVNQRWLLSGPRRLQYV